MLNQLILHILRAPSLHTRMLLEKWAFPEGTHSLVLSLYCSPFSQETHCFFGRSYLGAAGGHSPTKLVLMHFVTSSGSITSERPQG